MSLFEIHKRGDVEINNNPPQQDCTLCQPLYFCYTLTHFIHPSQATLRSPGRRCKNNHPCFRLVLISLFSGEATWDKAPATLDTSNQWNPQGLRWVFNEVHCSQLESPSPRNGLTFRLLLGFVSLFGSLLQLVDTGTKLPMRCSICLCGHSDRSSSLRHEAEINNLSLVGAHPPTITPFTLFSALLQSSIMFLFKENNSWSDNTRSSVVVEFGAVNYKTEHFEYVNSK